MRWADDEIGRNSVIPGRTDRNEKIGPDHDRVRIGPWLGAYAMRGAHAPMLKREFNCGSDPRQPWALMT